MKKDFKQFSLLTLRMIAQSEKYPRQLRRLKVMCNFLTTEIKIYADILIVIYEDSISSISIKNGKLNWSEDYADVPIYQAK